MNKIGTLVTINGSDLNDAIGYEKFDSSLIRALKLSQDSLFVLDDEAAEILNLPSKVDKLKKFGARFTDPRYVGIITGDPDSTNDDGRLEFDQPEYSKDEDDDDDDWDDNWGSL